MYGKKVSFLARGDSELNWDVKKCSCKSCSVLDEAIVDIEIEVRNDYIESEGSAILTSLLSRLKGDYRAAKVEITRGDAKIITELLFVHIDPRKRDEECKRSGYYFYDFFRSDKNVYHCKNALKRPRKATVKIPHTSTMRKQSGSKK